MASDRQLVRSLPLRPAMPCPLYLVCPILHRYNGVGKSAYCLVKGAQVSFAYCARCFVQLTLFLGMSSLNIGGPTRPQFDETMFWMIHDHVREH